MSEISIGLEAGQRVATAKVLNRVLSDEFILLVKTLNCHWNIKGADFRSLHQMLDEQYHALIEICDEVAERVRALGERAVGSMAGFHEHTSLKELHEHEPTPDSAAMLTTLTADHEAIVRELRRMHDDLEPRQHDVGTISLFEDLILRHEKMAWFLRANLN